MTSNAAGGTSTATGSQLVMWTSPTRPIITGTFVESVERAIEILEQQPFQGLWLDPVSATTPDRSGLTIVDFLCMEDRWEGRSQLTVITLYSYTQEEVAEIMGRLRQTSYTVAWQPINSSHFRDVDSTRVVS